MLKQARRWDLESQSCGRGGIASSTELDGVVALCTTDDEPAARRRGHALLLRWLGHAHGPTCAWTPCNRDDDRVQWRAIAFAPCESACRPDAITTPRHMVDRLGGRAAHHEWRRDLYQGEGHTADRCVWRFASGDRHHGESRRQCASAPASHAWLTAHCHRRGVTSAPPG